MKDNEMLSLIYFISLPLFNLLGDGDDLYQVAILVDQLKHDDVQQRVHAFSNLERIGIHN